MTWNSLERPGTGAGLGRMWVLHAVCCVFVLSFWLPEPKTPNTPKLEGVRGNRQKQGCLATWTCEDLFEGSTVSTHFAR